MPIGIKFDIISNHDPIVNSFNAIAGAVNRMSAFVRKAGGDIGDVFKLMADGGQADAFERRAQSMATVFNRLVENVGLAGDAVDAARDKIKKALDDVANSTESPKAKFQKFAAELSTILNDIKTMEAPLGNTSSTAAIPALEKRLKLEADILAVLEQQKAAAMQQRNTNAEGINRNKAKLELNEDELHKKYNGAAEGFYDEEDIQLLERGREAVANWTKAWEDSNAQVQTYDALIAESNARTEQMKHSVEELNNVYKGFADTAESTANKIFLDESKFERYEQLKARIKELKEELVKIGEGDDIDVPQLQELQEELRKNQEEFEALDRAARKTAEGLGTELSGKVQAAMTNLFKHQKIVRNAEEEYKKLKAQLDEAQKKLSEAKDPKAITTAQKEVDRLRVLLTAADDRLSRYKANLTDAKKEADRFQSSINGKGADLSRSVSGMLKNAAAVAGVGFGIAQAKQFGQQIMAVRGQFQQLEVAFKTMLGSEEKAVELMEQLTKTAAITPFDLQGVTQGAKQLLAYGISADKVNDTLIHLGDIAAGLSLPLGDLVYLYGTTMTQGRMFTQDLRQFMGRGIPIAEELAKQFGVTKDKVGELVTAGKVGAEEFNKAIMAMSSEGGKFAGLMEAQSKTISGQISNIGDAVDNMFNDIGKSSEGIINGALSTVSSLVENYEKVGKVIAEIVVIYGTYRAAIIAYNAIMKAHTAWIALEETAHLQNALATEAEVAAKGRATVATVLLEKAQKALSGTMLANPYVLAATAIAALTVVVYNLATAEEVEAKARRNANEQMEDFKNKLEAQRKRIEGYIHTLQDANATDYEKAVAWKQLSKEAPTLTKKYDETAIKAMNFADAQKKVKEEIENVNFQHAVDEVEKWNKVTNVLSKGHIDVYSKEYKEVVSLLKEAGFEYNSFSGDSYNKQMLAYGEIYLKNAQNELRKIQKIREEINEKNRPIEIRVKEANENYRIKQNILNFYDEARTLAKAVEDADYEMSSAVDANGKTNHDVAVQRFDDFIKRVEKELESPMTLKYGNDTEQVKSFVEELKQLKASWQDMFRTPIFVNFAMRFDQAKQAVEDAIKPREGMHFVESITGNEEHNGKWGYWQANVDETKTYSEKVKEYTDAINAANTKLTEAINKNAKDNGKAVKDAREALEKAKKDYKDFTGESFEKRRKDEGKNEKKREEARAREKQLAQKHAEEMVKLERAAERAREDARIAGIRSAAEREKAERESRHKRAIEDLKAQQQEIFKKIYQDRKAAYENDNKGKNNVTPYEQTKEGDIEKWNDYVNTVTSDSLGHISKSLQEVQEAEKKMLRELGKGDIMETLQQQFGNGNVDVLARPLVDAAELVRKGWKDAGEGIATVFSSSYEVVDKYGKSHEILVTPILPDGTVLSQLEMEDYIGKVLDGADDVLKADEKKLVIAVDIPVPDAQLQQLREGVTDIQKFAEAIEKIPSETAVTISTTLGKIETPDIPETATVHVTAEVDTSQYNALVEKFGEQSVKRILVETEGDIPQVSDETKTVTFIADTREALQAVAQIEGVRFDPQTLEVTADTEEAAGKLIRINGLMPKDRKVVVAIDADAGQLDDLRDLMPTDKTVTISTKVGDVSLPDIPQNATVSIDIESGDVGEKLHLLHEQLTDLPTDKINIIKELYKDIDIDPTLAALRKVQEQLNTIDPSQLEAAFATIEKISLSRLTEDENKQFRLGLKQRLSDAAKNNAERTRSEIEYQKQRISSMREYIKEYGSLEQRRQAITHEYDDKIAEERDTFQRAILEKKKESAIQDLNFRELQADFNWEQVFGDLSHYSTEALRGLKEKLRNALDAKDITAENAEVISEKIIEIEDRISEKSDIWASLIPGLKERKRLIEQAETAEENYRKSLKKEQEALFGVLDARTKVAKALSDAGVRKDDGTSYTTLELSTYNDEQLKAVVKKVEGMGDAGKAAKEALEGLQKSTIDLNRAQAEAAKKKNVSAQFEGMLNGSSTVKDYFNAATKGGEALGVVGFALQNAASLSELVDTIGLHDTEFGKAVDSFSEGCQGFQQAISALQNGDVVGAVTGVIKGLQGWGKTLETAFGFSFSGSNADEVRKKDEELIKANESLKESIERLRDTMEKEAGVNAVKAGVDAAQNQEKYNENLLERWANDMGYHDAHRSNSYYYGLDETTVSQVNEALAAYAQKYETDLKSITADKWEDLMALTPEEMDYIRKNAQDAWEDITTEGEYDWVYDAVNEYADQANKVEEITQELYENLTQTTQQNVFDTFLNDMYDIADGADDVTENIEKRWQEMVNHMVVKNLIGGDMQKDLEKWYKKLGELQKRKTEGMNNQQYLTELEQLKTEYNGLIENGQKQVEDLKKAGIIQETDKTSSSQQSATFNSAQNITYEQADGIWGTLIGHTMLHEHSNATCDLILQNLQTMQTAFGGTFGEIRNLTIQANSTRETMLKLMKEHFESFDTKMTIIYKELKAQA